MELCSLIFFLETEKDNGENNWLETKIAENVIIGSNATILPVKICEGCVIGAGSVVTKNIAIKVYAESARLIRKL